MDFFEFNKIAGAVLGTLLLTMAIGIVSDALFYRPPPAVPGYELPTAPEQPAGAAAPAPAPAAEPLPVLLAKADPKKGENFAKVCGVCHSFEKGGGVKIGPPLYGIVGRPVASVAGLCLFGFAEAAWAAPGPSTSSSSGSATPRRWRAIPK